MKTLSCTRASTWALAVATCAMSFGTANAQDAVPKGEWWKAFGDPVLDNLEATAIAGSPTLRAAVARVDEARATARLARSQFYPQLTLDPTAKRERTSGNLPTPIPFPVPAANIDTFSLPLDLSYEIDLWGRVRRSFTVRTFPMRKVLHVRKARKHLRRSARARSSRCPCTDARSFN